MILYPFVNSEGVIWLNDVSLNGIGTFITNAVSQHNTVVKWYCVRANPSSDANPGYFSSASFSIMWNCSSINYGWTILMSDDSNFILFGRLNVGRWHWYHPTLTEVN